MKVKSLLAGIIRDLHEFDWRELASPQGSGGWPAAVRTSVVLLLTSSLLAGGYLLRLRDLQERNARLALEEAELAAELDVLRTRVASLDDYRQRAREIEEPYMRMLRQLPYESEIPALIDEITSLGLSFGLNFDSIELAAELDRPHYVEQPIDIRVSGGYHEIGAFFSGVAALGRIVTMHDFSLRELSAEELELELLARTYRYRPLPEASAGPETAQAVRQSPIQLEQGHAEQFNYAAGARPNPFAPLALPGATGPEAARPGLNPLEKYALHELRLAGLLKYEEGNVGLLQDPSGTVHRVERGDYLGPDQGRVQRITDLGVELIEWKTDETGAYAQQETLLPWENGQ
ncbi:MAG: type 4a pilus biogenesis protein PilO [Gammaproteobacteria bacterium]|nr:type 4a pilus biogenesis protein PilO [Gammaproteobacteria bacterium]MYK06007.1 type 4a pilus biogenesis protein PilO [Gammaproteobacteria bacterium]